MLSWLNQLVKNFICLKKSTGIRYVLASWCAIKSLTMNFTRLPVGADTSGSLLRSC
jgi:hypothetical protein